MNGVQFAWREAFATGVASIDKEHQQLFKIVNKLFDLKEEETDRQWLCQEGIKFFKGHALKHFANEEAYMAQIQFEGLKRHAAIHAGFRENTLPALEEELERTEYAADSVEHFFGVCVGWLIGHTLTEDLTIVGKGAKKWENLLPSEETEAMKKIITQRVRDMFSLNARLISDTYHGEKFGNGIYYRLVYGKGKEKKRLEVVLAFEEKLLVNTIGALLGIKTSRVDSVLIHASRYTTRQFVGNILEQFPSMDGYELKEENLLSYEQIERMFDKEKMQVSLLFNTGGGGYFAYCVIAPHLLEKGVGTPLAENGNAQAEVEKFLEKREAKAQEEELHPKKKVLVVDDSRMLRTMMKDLLDADYDVAMAESGVAAIRSITLNMPDLVLLDYEMPVCDGRQTLEMLRSEPGFANLPVIFLTGKGDPDSVRKVMSLKPAGYLLKQLQPEAIKKEIDAFFQKRKKA